MFISMMGFLKYYLYTVLKKSFKRKKKNSPNTNLPGVSGSINYFFGGKLDKGYKNTLFTAL